MRIVLVRHGETEWSASGQHTSTTDIPLTEPRPRGRPRARPRLGGRDFALVLASPRARALETARLAGFEPEVEPDLVEIDYGDYEGRTTPRDPRGAAGLDALARRLPGWRDARRRPASAPTA